MHGTENDADVGRVFNVFQLVALSAAATAGAVVAYSAAGAPFGASLMAGFATGPCLTMVIALTVAWIKDKTARSTRMFRGRRTESDVTNGPPLTQGPISTIEELWNSDHMLEMEYARGQNSSSLGGRSRRTTPSEHVAMWELDADMEAQVAKALPKSLKKADRQQISGDSPHIGVERKVARR